MVLRFARRLLMTLGLFTLLPVVVASVAWFWRGPVVPERSILHVVLDGALAEAPEDGVASLWQDGTDLTLVTLAAKLRAAAHDSRIVGLLLEVKDAKVGLAQLEELSRAVADFRKSGKWSMGYLESTGDAGGGDGVFALASLAKEVALSPPGEIRLAGMHAEVPFVANTFERAHVDVHVQQRYEYKNYANTFTQTGFTPAHRESLASLLDDMQGTLLARLADNRHVSTAEVARWVEAAPFHSEAAKERGLVDRLAYWDEVVAIAEEVAGHKDALLDAEAYEAKASKAKQVTVAYVVGEGEITSGGGMRRPGSSGMESDVYVEALRQAREDKVRAVLLRIDSPGGSYLASDLIRREVARTRAEKIPVVVSMGNTAASGGYFIAAEADHIVAEAGTITGSIGVVGASFAVGRALEHFFGVHFDRYSSLSHPGTLDALAPPSPQQTARLSAEIDRIYNDFVSKVAAGRHKSFAEVHALAKGRVWTGRQAVESGLVDSLGGVDVAMAYLERRLDLPADAQLVLQPYPPPKSALEVVRDTLDTSMSAGGMRAWLRQQARALVRETVAEAARPQARQSLRLPQNVAEAAAL